MINPVLIENQTMIDTASAIRQKLPNVGTMLPSAFAENILKISGGGIDLPDYVHMGTFTVAVDTVEEPVIEHGFSKAPELYIVMADEAIEEAISYSICGGFSMMNLKGIMRKNATKALGMYVNAYPQADDTFITVKNISSNYFFRAGWTYRWIAWSNSEVE